MAGFEEPIADWAWKLKSRQATRTEPFDHKRHPLAASMWSAVARRAAQIR
jgi:hypothetical protein